MFVLASHIVIAVMRFSRRWLPSHRLVAYLRTRRGLRWGLPAAGLGIAYLMAARWLFELVAAGATQWLYLGDLLLLAGAARLIAGGLFAVPRLVVVRCREHWQLTVAVRRENRDRRADDLRPVSRRQARDALAQYRRELVASPGRR